MRRIFYLAIGWIMVVLGVIGAVLPIMPTVPFLIVAAAAFARSSPELEEKLLNHPHFGASLKAWREQGAISPRAKMLAVLAMGGSFVSVLVFGTAFVWLQVAIGLTLLACSTYVLTRPSPQVSLNADNA